MNVKLLTKCPKFVIRLGGFVRQYAPEILMGLGGATSVAAVAVAINQTPKASAIVDAALECEDLGVELTIQDKAKDILDICKIYAPVAGIEAISLTCFLAAHNVMAKRHAALYSAYIALDQAFQQYRDRVIAKYGANEDRYFSTGMIPGQTVQYTDKETGEVKTDTNARIFDENAGHSIYARYFDESSREWCKSPTTNMMKLKHLEKQFNDMLVLRGYVFLNEVYKELDLPQTAEGQIVGWVNDPEYGECQVDFGITDGYKMVSRALTENLYDRAILLDFNVDGPIYEYLNKRNRRRILETTPGPLTTDGRGRLIDEIPVPESYPEE